jgi:hypothetical protein
VIWGLVALLIAKRIAYHLAYIVSDAFALGTFSDGQLYEIAARDILAHPPLGSEPFYLQGTYAYLLALPMMAADKVVMGLWLQLMLAAFALYLFQRAARTAFGPLVGGVSLLVLLAAPEVAFYENKYLSVSFGIALNVVALFAAVRALEHMRWRDIVLAGVGAGLAWLGRPNMMLALPFTALALVIGGRALQHAVPTQRVLIAFGLGALLAVAPLAIRNQIVVGAPQVIPSHGGGVPFYIGNNPFADGRWNSAGGLFSGMVTLEKGEIARKLGITAEDPARVDAAIGSALYGKAFEFIRENPQRFVELCALKLWLMIGNHRFVRDYDIGGEAELVGGLHHVGLPFGLVLGIGSLGLWVLARRARQVRGERAKVLALLLILVGQIVAIGVANVLVFTSAQNRVPLYVPLAFVAGPALEALFSKLRKRPSRFELTPLAIALSVALCAQAFWPRAEPSKRPSSAHYYNLAAVEEKLGRLEDAAGHFARAVQQNPRQPMFHISLARVLRRMGRFEEARAALDQLIGMPNVASDIYRLAHRERGLIIREIQDPPADGASMR